METIALFLLFTWLAGNTTPKKLSLFTDRHKSVLFDRRQPQMCFSLHLALET